MNGLGLLNSAVSVLPKRPRLNSHGAGPALGVHDEDTSRPDNHVVDAGVWPAGQLNVVQDLEAVATQEVQGRSDELLSVLTQFQVPCGTSGVHRAPVLVDCP